MQLRPSFFLFMSIVWLAKMVVRCHKVLGVYKTTPIPKKLVYDQIRRVYGHVSTFGEFILAGRR